MLKSIEKKMSRLHYIISPISLDMILRCLEHNLFANIYISFEMLDQKTIEDFNNIYP